MENELFQELLNTLIFVGCNNIVKTTIGRIEIIIDHFIVIVLCVE